MTVETDQWLNTLARIGRIISSPGGGKPSLVLRALSEQLRCPLALYALEQEAALIGNTGGAAGAASATVEDAALRLCFYAPAPTQDRQQAAFDCIRNLWGVLQQQRHLIQTNRLLTILRDVSSLDAEEVSVRDLLRRITERIAMRMDAGAASIMMLDQCGQYFAYEVASGDLSLLVPDDWPISIGVAGRCIRENAAQLILDPATDPDYVVGNESVMAEYLVPLQIDHQPIGALNIESTDPALFSEENRAIFDAIAHQISGTIFLLKTMDALKSSNEELRAANVRLHRQTQLDGLTQLLNRSGLERALGEAWRALERDDQPFSLLMLDFDNFKAFNDNHGHVAGDAQLINLAELLRELFENDPVARYGGEEFSVVLAGRHCAEAAAAGERVVQAVRAHPAIRTTLSVGVAEADPAMPDFTVLIEQADAALYQAKADGKDRVHAAMRRP